MILYFISCHLKFIHYVENDRQNLQKALILLRHCYCEYGVDGIFLSLK